MQQNKHIMETSPGQVIPTFRYALRLTPERMHTLTAEQKDEALHEFITLLGLILTILYNPLAKEATRLLSLDVLLTQVQRSVRKLISAVTDKSPTFAPETEKRLGLSKNTISSGYKTLEKAGVLERSYRTDELTRQEHLDIALTPALFTNPSLIQDKKKRAAPKPKLKVKPVDPARECLTCGSRDLRITCRKCGSYIDLGEVEHVCAQPSEQEQNHQDANASQSIPITNFGTGNKNEVVESVPITPPAERAQARARDDAGDEANTSEHEAVTILGMGNKNEVLEQVIEAEQSDIPITAPSGDDSVDASNTSQSIAVTNFGTFSPITPPHVPSKIITTWLEQRIGEGQLIYATGKTEQNEKYLSLPVGSRPDMAAYLRGDLRHLYGSRLATAGSTRILGFDIDKSEQDAHCDIYLQKLSEAGAFPLYWHRQNNRGHLELYFSEPVNAEAAYKWCCTVCPILADIPECYPVNEKKSNGFSWPLYQRVGNDVYECPVSYWACRGFETIDGMISDPSAVETLVELAVTPASLIPESNDAETCELATLGLGGVLLEKPLEDRLASLNHDHSPETDLADVVIADFNESHTWEEIAALCGGLKHNRFYAVWRGEQHASVVIDPDGCYACDYGRIGTHSRKKLDKYEVWCLAQGIEKKRDLAERITSYRKEHQVPASSPPPAPPHEEEKSLTTEQTAPPQKEVYWWQKEEQLVEKIPDTFFTVDPPCETCGCPLYRQMAEYQVCVRCYPSRGYHLYQHQVDAKYPRGKQSQS